jgi:hypothetical protein
MTAAEGRLCLLSARGEKERTARNLWMTKFHVTVVLTIVPVSVTYSLEPRPIGRAAAGRPYARGECGARARTCNPPGGIGHQPLGTTTGAR